MHNIVLAFDSFKGSITAAEATACARQAILRHCPEMEIAPFPIADGGEGTTEIIGRCLPVQQITCQTHNPLMEEMEASYLVTTNGTVILEMAAASGLTLVPPDRRNPMNTTTLGTGEMIADALSRGYRHFILGLGGSATNDAGVGALSALGVRFRDDANREVEPVGGNLHRITRLDTTHLRPELRESSFTIACDVTNPFAGPSGAAYIYAPQKGASPAQVRCLDDGLQHYADVLLKETGMDISLLPGAGAAGGMGGGLLPFLNARLQSGIDIVLELLHFEEAVRSADLVITGEGKIDSQTAMGKALSGVLSIARKHQVPVVALGGSVEEVPALNAAGFTCVLSIQPSPGTLEKAMQREFALQNLEQTVTQLLRLLTPSTH
ncbi:MAG: glycerate kinase [Prevotellaceae bacterium]|nr:glycerate kinase [Prevotellaceae bacterium]